jgi:uncharacterized protein YndB with AHSA1/START domain
VGTEGVSQHIPGFRNTFQLFEPRPGGSWKFVMHGPNGADYTNSSVLETLMPGERIVIRHASGPRFTLTVILAADGAGIASPGANRSTPRVAVS